MGRAVSEEPSTTSEVGAVRGSEDCPRCGALVESSFNYCPNCACRVRPATLDYRLHVLGYLALASTVLLVIFVGFQLLGPREAPPEAHRWVKLARDTSPLGLTPEDSFGLVDAGYAFWGLHDPSVLTSEVEAYYVDDAFQLCVHEITNDQYCEFLHARARKTGEPVPGWLYPTGWAGPTRNEFVQRIYDRHKGDLPVAGLPLLAALEFCGWFWEERLEADPDLVVDLPSWLEYVRAARGDSLGNNFPWGGRLMDEAVKFNLWLGDPLPVNDEQVGNYRGFFALVGNVSELVHWADEWTTPVVAAGWSCEDAGVYKEGVQTTPFSLDGFRVIRTAQGSANVGFRIVIRRAPALPGFVRVEAGVVRHLSPPRRLLPPDRSLDLLHERAPARDQDIDLLAEDLMPETLREDPITFPQETRTVARDFEIARTEVTNRQYLYFLAAIAPESTTDELEKLVPRTWQRRNLLSEKAVFRGCFVDSARLKTLYTPGCDNHPVQGVTLAQVRAYCAWVSRKLQEQCRIPTVGQYLQAGRQSGTRLYPWGDDTLHTGLVCCDRADSRGRAVSVLGRMPEDPAHLFGLVGNLAEFVIDDLNDDRLLLAGGCYEFPASLCTLDCFLDAAWPCVQYQIEVPKDEGEAEQTELDRSPPIRVDYHTGFRVVK
ncbi:MAG: SUMF1/EgtB/PvdO family nonheme iron enzyme [Planctomycetota bacterium]|jgi:formylglycine-generating enzyme required for sulfatase activity